LCANLFNIRDHFNDRKESTRETPSELSNKRKQLGRRPENLIWARNARNPRRVLARTDKGKRLYTRE